jgi:hypothetical protein
VFPNPTQNWIQIDAPAFESAQLFDLNGRLILNSSSQLIHCTHLEKGIYLLSVRTDKNVVMKKIVVQ